jgi:uncharacterized membrane protein
MTARATRYAVGSLAVVALLTAERWLMTQDWTDFAKWCASLGVGGILAAFMFMFYRRDMKDRLANQQQQTDLLTDVVKENTSAITTLTTEIRLRGGWLSERYASMSSQGRREHS